jgi:hypothetical protein
MDKGEFLDRTQTKIGMLRDGWRRKAHDSSILPGLIEKINRVANQMVVKNLNSQSSRKTKNK